MKILNTTKLFYNKYVYRLSIRCPLASIFRHKDLAYARRCLDAMQQNAEADLPLYIPSRFFKTPVKFDDFQDACVIFSYLKNQNSDYLVRCESTFLNLYSNNEKWLAELSTKVDALEFNQPADDISKDFLINNQNTIIVDGPVKYQYKVYCGSGVDPAFADYVEANKDKVKMGPTALRDVRNGFIYGHYFYARDEKILTVVSMFMKQRFSRIIKLVPKELLDK